ncbi:hypothetical protein Btru_063923 [Bulinus truncatus]|nr:hypothetical protein Btru_063923 [Bulinus truncatus]
MSKDMSESTEVTSDMLVLVTGASGYVATHLVKLLQESGYRVRGTVRSLKDEKKVKHLYNLCPSAKHRLELVEADLLLAESWTNAVKGCHYIHHVASPFPIVEPRDENELIKPAVDGTLNVLKAAAENGIVKRVVLTSSVAAVAACGGNSIPYNEQNWADDKASGTLAYSKSKIRAERAAWDFVKSLPDAKNFELSVVNPTLVVGPVLHGSSGSSTDIIKRLMEHQMPACPKFNFGVIDVRDVAKAHIKCMTLDEAQGHRHILCSGNLWLSDIAKILDKEFRSQGYNIPTGELPNFVVTLAGIFDKSIKSGKALASKVTLLDNSRMKNILGITPIPIEQTFVDMGYTMIENGFVEKTSNYRGFPRS